MASIKLSGVMTDIRGKLNGSVFSRTLAGAVVKNNKYGGGQNSQRWQKQKSKMASVSKQWQNLSEEQQTAWREYAQTFQVKNKVGDLVNISGFNAFCQINANSVGGMNEIRTTPPTRTAFPTLSDVDLIVPQIFQFVPLKYIELPKGSNGVTEIDIFDGGAKTVGSEDKTIKVSMNILIDESMLESLTTTQYFKLFEIYHEDGGGVDITLQKDEAGDLYLDTNFHWEDASHSKISVNVTGKIIKGMLPFTAIFPRKGTKEYKIVTSLYCDETIVELSLNSPLDEKQRQFKFMGAAIDSKVIYNASNLCLWEDIETDLNGKLANYGYCEVFPKWQMPLDNWKDEKSLLYNSDGTTEEVYVFSNVENVKSLKSFESFMTPRVELEGNYDDVQDYKMNVMITNPISKGVVGNYTKRKKLTTVEFPENKIIDLSPDIFKEFGYLPSNCSLAISGYLTNPANGDISTTAIAQTKNKVRFKAGSSLDARVN